MGTGGGRFAVSVAVPCVVCVRACVVCARALRGGCVRRRWRAFVIVCATFPWQREYGNGATLGVLWDPS